MPATVLERTSEQITEAVEKASHATSNIGDAVHERFDESKILVRRGAHRAEELLDRGKVHVKRHPLAALSGTFALGLGIGMLVGWTTRRK